MADFPISAADFTRLMQGLRAVPAAGPQWPSGVPMAGPVERPLDVPQALPPRPVKRSGVVYTYKGQTVPVSPVQGFVERPGLRRNASAALPEEDPGDQYRPPRRVGQKVLYPMFAEDKAVDVGGKIVAIKHEFSFFEGKGLHPNDPSRYTAAPGCWM